MKEMIIYSTGKYDYTDGTNRLYNIGKKKADGILKQWKKDGKDIKHRYLMGGKVVQCYTEARK